MTKKIVIDYSLHDFGEGARESYWTIILWLRHVAFLEDGDDGRLFPIIRDFPCHHDVVEEECDGRGETLSTEFQKYVWNVVG